MCKTGYLRDSKGICVAHPCFRLGPCGADLYASCTPTLSNVSVANCTQCRTAYVRNISAPGAICVPDVCYVNPCSDPGTNCVRSFTPSKANCVPKTGYIQNTVTAMWVPDPCLPSSTNVVCGGDINAVCRPTADFTGQDCYRCKAGYLRHPVNGTCVKNLCLEGCPEDPDAWCQHTPDYLDIDCSLCRTGYTKDGGDFCQVAPPTLELSSHLGSHTCVRHAQGLKCFGVGTGGVLGTGSTADVGDLPYEMGRNLSFVDVLGSNYSTVLDVAAGNAFACALLSPGNALRCWGQNANGQLGLPTAGGTLGAAPGQMGDALPLVNLGGANVTQLALGGDHACALLTAANGTTSVKCWGNNAVGQAGRVGFAAAVNTNGSTVADVALGPTANVSAVTQVVAGVGFTCALVQPYGRVKCWGTGLYNATVAAAAGVVGRAAGSMGSNLSFVNLGTSAAVLQLAAGSSHVCAVLSPGNRLKCWGRNAAGQLGLNDTVDRGNAAGDSSYGMGSGLPDVPLGANVSRIAKVEAGGSHTCVLTLPGNIVRCWGLNDKGQLGYGDTTTRRAPPTETVSISSVLNVTDVVAGDKHTCVVALPGSVVKCWGNGRAIGRGNGTANMGSGPGEMGAALLTLDFGWDPCYPDWCPGDPLAQCQPNANFTAPVCDTCQPSYAKDDGTCSVCDDGFVRNATDASCRSCPVFPGYSVQTHVDAEGPNLIDSYVDSPAQACSDSPHCLGFSLGQDGEFDTGYLKRSVAVTYMYRDICLYTRLELPDYDCPDVPGFTAARGVDLEGAAIGGVGGDLWVDDPATACAANPSCAFFSTGYEGDFSAGVLRTATSDPTVPYYGVCLYAKNTSPPPAPTAPPPNLFDPCDAAPCDADPNAVCVPSPDYSAFTCDCTSGFVRDPAGPAACVASTPCAPLTGYTVQPDADAPGTDLSSDLAYDPVADCNADPACMGFVTGVVEGVYDMAVLKSDVTFTSFARGMCLYSKLGGAAKAVQSPQPAAATPGSGAPQGAPTVAADDGTVPVPGVAPAPAPTPASSGPSSPSSGSGASSTGTIVGATVGAVGGATLLAAAVAAVVVAKRRRSHAGGGRAAGDSEQAGGGNGAPSRGKSGGVVGVGLEAEWRQLSVSKKAFGRTDSRVHSITSAQAPALGLDSPNGTTTTTATTASSAANTTDAANLDGVWGQMHAVVRSPPRPADGRVASLTTGMQRADSRTAQGQLLLPSASSPRGPRPESGERSRPAGAGGPAGGPY
ncbi:hypothetical protein HYH03_001674 [Edaphochlamys debaryana]|uniref:EGF-like domain-containing protein n=1 Tax=Edaphochlamys debaryana TaxID=47281 RepID=A0A835YCC8_9CHLO|nr:hypothetical protein HYH03_001674 [Edaphochlamys debaryana]|eukprot:KAG2500088.1 hypothetical protein HYH03_001674 [Edaphochlamys debaryana]